MICLKKFQHNVTLIGPLSQAFLEQCNAINYITAQYKELHASFMLDELKLALSTQNGTDFVKVTYLHQAV